MQRGAWVAGDARFSLTPMPLAPPLERGLHTGGQTATKGCDLWRRTNPLARSMATEVQEAQRADTCRAQGEDRARPGRSPGLMGKRMGEA